MSSDRLDSANRRVVKRLGWVVLGMFGFGFALVPLYDALCDLTGLNGKTGQIEAQAAATYEIDESRLITVEFWSHVNSELPWQFKPLVKKMKVHPGEVAEAIFVAENTTNMEIVGQAVPSMAPNLAAKYFNKTECFCFTQQTLGPKERREMPLRFVIDPDLPENVTSVALSYTLFKISETQVSESNDLALLD